MKHFPDFRRILNELQRYSVSGEIDAGILTTISDKSIKDLMRTSEGKELEGYEKVGCPQFGF